jgi:hypothetical protein
MVKRSAEATIKGYYYQFDTTILKLIESTNGADSVVVEGIEDIDITSGSDIETIQCKYLSARKSTNSLIREPISLMLTHFVANSTNPINYTLYAHFEDETPNTEKTIDLTLLKNILTHKEKVNGLWEIRVFHIDNSISDAQLSAFLARFKLRFGEEFETQQKKVVQKLKAHFTCEDYDAEKLFYNNSLRIVMDKAIKKTVAERTLTKTDFINAINCGKILFSIWFKKYRTNKEYLVDIANRIKSTRALNPSKTKIIYIGKNILDADNSELPVSELIQNIIDKHYKVGAVFYNATPPMVVLDLDLAGVTALKKDLIRQGVKFNDGQENIEFNVDLFNEKPIINKKGKTTKIGKSSYTIKLINKQTFDNFKTQISVGNVFMFFSNCDYPYQSLTDNTCQLHDIKYCNNLKDLSKLIC